MSIRDDFSKNLPYYMSLAGVNQVELAKSIGISKSTVSTWISGRSYPRIETVQKVADLLGCTTDDLVTENPEVIRSQLSEDKKELFRLARNASPAAIRAAVAVLESMEKTNNEF